MDYPRIETTSRLFARQADAAAEAIAVRGPDDRALSYGELEIASNRLAGVLTSRGIGEGSRVGVYLERGVELASALLAVMKSGAAYVPLDPMFPTDRLAYMIADAELGLIVTQSSLVSRVPVADCEQVIVDSREAELVERSVDGIDRSDLEAAAYVIYTSGSTGKPKGVEVAHRSLSNLLCSMRDEPGLSNRDRMLAVTTLSFDIAALEVYLPLMVGAQLILASREESVDSELLATRMTTCEASVVQATPATWKMLVESGWRGHAGLRIWCGGEAMSRDLADQLLGLSDEVWNLYGPTETTIWSTRWRVEPGTGDVPVGRPIANTRLHVVDDDGRPVAPGTVGELCIGGEGVARGYLNRAALTAERFVADDLSGHPGGRLFRTGDRARLREDGLLEIHGRLDDQIKLHGHRIELGEIRAALVENDSVRDALVMVRDDGPPGERLVAYVRPDGSRALDTNALREALRTRLPEYMVPSAWVELAEFPLTPNRKIDRKRLPVPQVEVTTERPLSEAESRVAAVWQSVLTVDIVGPRSNFFELGGNSLAAIRLVAKLKTECGIRVPVISLFQGATVADLAKQLSEARPETGGAVGADRADSVPDSRAGDDDADFEGATIASIAVSLDTAADSPSAAPVTGHPACRLLTSVGGTGTPFFMVGSHPRYRDAVERLADARPAYRLDAYALQAGRLAARRIPYRSIEAIASALLPAVRDVQPRGPYLLGGGCEGSLIALELARQLRAAGETVSSLSTWGTPAPGPVLQAAFAGSSLKRLWRQFQSIRAKGSLRELGWRGLAPLVSHEIVEHSLFAAMLRYRPTGTTTGSMCLAVLDPMPDEPDLGEPSLGWDVYLEEGVRVHRLRGNHDTWLRDHVDDFAAFLERELAPTP